MVIVVAGGASEKLKRDDSAVHEHPKVSLVQAQKAALAKEPGMVKSKELEKEHGKLVYSFDIRTMQGTHEVNVDAITGRVIEDSVDAKAAELKQNQSQDRR